MQIKVKYLLSAALMPITLYSAEGPFSTSETKVSFKTNLYNLFTTTPKTEIAKKLASTLDNPLSVTEEELIKITPNVLDFVSQYPEN